MVPTCTCKTSLTKTPVSFDHTVSATSFALACMCKPGLKKGATTCGLYSVMFQLHATMTFVIEPTHSTDSVAVIHKRLQTFKRFGYTAQSLQRSKQNFELQSTYQGAEAALSCTCAPGFLSAAVSQSVDPTPLQTAQRQLDMHLFEPAQPPPDVWHAHLHRTVSWHKLPTTALHVKLQLHACICNVCNCMQVTSKACGHCCWVLFLLVSGISTAPSAMETFARSVSACCICCLHSSFK